MSYDEDYKLNSKTEEYLQNHEGKLNTWYEKVAEAAPFRAAFVAALAKPDIVRLRVAGKTEVFSALGGDEIDDADVLAAIDFLESTKGDYTESHPIWHTR